MSPPHHLTPLHAIPNVSSHLTSTPCTPSRMSPPTPHTSPPCTPSRMSPHHVFPPRDPGAFLSPKPPSPLLVALAFEPGAP
eukprot:214997-Chlamydomonas_euryale.AAC.4